MKKIIFSIFILVFTFNACKEKFPTNLEKNSEQGQVLFSLNKANTPANVAEVIVTLTREEYENMTKTINIEENDYAQVLFEDLDAGTWQIYVEALNNEKNVLYFGETKANVTPGIITPINLELNPTTGGINIFITWGKSLHENVVAFYPFIGNANDYSENGLHGNVYGAELSEDRFGNTNNAFYFDGLDDYIQVERNTKLNIEGDLTLSVWIKPESFDGIANPLLRLQADNTDDDQTNLLYGLNFNYGSNKLTYAHENDQGINNSHTFQNFEFNTSIWYNLIIVRNTDKKIVELFVDGILQDTIQYAENPNNGNLSFLNIGNNQGTTYDSRFYHGSIDDIIILNKALTKQEIELLYNFSK